MMPSFTNKMGYSRKILPFPHRGGWISRLFLVKYCPGFPGFLNKSPYFHTDFQITHAPKIHTFFFCFLALDFRETFVKQQVEFVDFYIRIALTSSMWEGHNLSGFSPIEEFGISISVAYIEYTFTNCQLKISLIIILNN